MSTQPAAEERTDNKHGAGTGGGVDAGEGTCGGGVGGDTGERPSGATGQVGSAVAGDRSADDPPGPPPPEPPEPPDELDPPDSSEGQPVPDVSGDAPGPGPSLYGGVCDGSAADPCLDQTSAEEAATGKTIPYPVRLGHALIDLIEHIPAAAVPDTAGAAASILVTVRADQLSTGLGVATLDTGTVISAGQARRLACAAGIIPMVLGGRSEPLDVGREQRLHTRAQRLAAAHRQDHACGVDGCDRPITAYHHPLPWSHGGATSLANCLGLCGYHHHLAHHPAWRLDHTNHTWTLHRL